MVQSEVKASRHVAIDLGSSRIRWGVAEDDGNSGVNMLGMDSKSVRLGEDVFTSGTASRQAVDKAVKAINEWRGGAWLDLGAETFFPVATSALREATNGVQVRSRLFGATGLPFLIIDGRSEAEFISRAILQEIGRDTNLADKTVLLIDYGGGSTEFSLAIGGRLCPESVHSIPVGSMRQILHDGFEIPVKQDAALASVHDLLAETLQKVMKYAPEGKADLVVGSGGNIREYASLHRMRTAGHSGQTLTWEDLDAHIRVLQSVPVEKRSRAFPISDARSDVIVPAGRVFQMCLEIARADSIRVAQSGLRHGLLLTALDGLRSVSTESNFESALRFARFCNSGLGANSALAEDRSKFALSAFDSTQQIHGLEGRHRSLLQVASLVQDVGERVVSADPHKASFQIIMTLPFGGLSTRDKLYVASLVRHARGQLPDAAKHDHLEGLATGDRLTFSALSALMRFASDMGDATTNPSGEFDLQLNQGRLSVGLNNGFSRARLSRILQTHEQQFRAVLQVGLETRTKVAS